MEYLGNDGVFILRLLSGNTNDVVMAELMGKMWLRYRNFRYTAKKNEKNESSSDVQIEEIDVLAKENNGSGDKDIVMKTSL